MVWMPLALLSAGTTVTAGYTTFQTDYNPTNGATAGRFNLVYVVAGSTLEDYYTEGISGDVIARDGNTVTLLGATLFLNTADEFFFCGVVDVNSLCRGLPRCCWERGRSSPRTTIRRSPPRPA